MWLVRSCKNLNNPLCYIAYALGFALGTYFGIMVEEKLAIGFLVLRIFVPKENPGKESLMEKLIKAGFGVTAVEGRGSTKEVTLLFSLIRRKDLDEAVAIIEQADSKVFYSIESVKAAHAGIFPRKPTGYLLWIRMIHAAGCLAVSENKNLNLPAWEPGGRVSDHPAQKVPCIIQAQIYQRIVDIG